MTRPMVTNTADYLCTLAEWCKRIDEAPEGILVLRPYQDFVRIAAGQIHDDMPPVFEFDDDKLIVYDPPCFRVTFGQPLYQRLRQRIIPVGSTHRCEARRKANELVKVNLKQWHRWIESDLCPGVCKFLSATIECRGGLSGKSETVPAYIGPKSPADWARQFDVSWKTIKRRMQRGEIRAVKVNAQQWKIHRGDVPESVNRSSKVDA